MTTTEVQIRPDHPARLSLQAWLRDGWRELAMHVNGSVISAEEDGVEVELRVQDGDAEGHLRYTLRVRSSEHTRVRLSVSLAAADAFHLIPCCIFGDNNLAAAEAGHFPNLTHAHPESVSCADYWEFRADRASLPVSAMIAGGQLCAVSVAPYTDCADDDTTSDEGFVRNGVFAALGTATSPHRCGVTLGYGNAPVTFVNKDEWGEPTAHRCRRADVAGHIYLGPAADRRAVHAVLADLYGRLRSRPPEPISRDVAMQALVRALCTISWQPDKRNFSNMNTMADPERRQLRSWRTVAEIGWSGGAMVGYPLLAAAMQLGDADAIANARHSLDWAARAYNEASGFLWDVCGETEGRSLNGWWSGYLVTDVHCAYTNGSAVYNLLRAAALLADTDPAAASTYRTVACRVLDTVCHLQLPDGNVGYTYSPERPEIVDREGFAGAWFMAGLALAYSQTGDSRYRAAAARGMAYYHGFVRELTCWGSPMDTWKSIEQEGNLGFIRAARLLHEATQEQRYLDMLTDAAHYEYLWRYGFAARPEFPPLKGSPWNSCGGSVTSVSNPHIHPMGLLANDDLRYLADATGEPLHRQRYEDGLSWALNTVGLYPDVSGYGELGVVTERFCPSDGLTIETYPDGSPASIWFSYNAWAAASFLDALI